MHLPTVAVALDEAVALIETAGLADDCVALMLVDKAGVSDTDVLAEIVEVATDDVDVLAEIVEVTTEDALEVLMAIDAIKARSPVNIYKVSHTPNFQGVSVKSRFTATTYFTRLKLTIKLTKEGMEICLQLRRI